MNTYHMQQKCEEGQQDYTDLIPTLMNTTQLVKFEQLLKSELDKRKVEFMEEFPLLSRFFNNPNALHNTDATVMKHRMLDDSGYYLRLSYALSSSYSFLIDIDFKTADSPLDTICKDIMYIFSRITNGDVVLNNKIHCTLFNANYVSTESKPVPFLKQFINKGIQTYADLIPAMFPTASQFMRFENRLKTYLSKKQDSLVKAYPMVSRFFNNPNALENTDGVIIRDEFTEDYYLQLGYSLTSHVMLMIYIRFDFNKEDGAIENVQHIGCFINSKGVEVADTRHCATYSNEAKPSTLNEKTSIDASAPKPEEPKIPATTKESITIRLRLISDALTKISQECVRNSQSKRITQKALDKLDATSGVIPDDDLFIALVTAVSLEKHKPAKVKTVFAKQKPKRAAGALPQFIFIPLVSSFTDLIPEE